MDSPKLIWVDQTSTTADNPALAYLRNALFYLEKDYPEDSFLIIKSEIRKVLPTLGEIGEQQWLNQNSQVPAKS